MYLVIHINNQWMIEVKDWFAISLARFQHAVVEYATGPGPLADGQAVLQPTDDDGLALCHAQKVRGDGSHQSFSVLGLAITLGVGGLIILVSFILEPLMKFTRQKRSKDTKQRGLNWTLDGNLQLLRMVHEYAGMGHWIHIDEEIPITTDGQEKIFTLPKGMTLNAPGWASGDDEQAIS